MDGRMEERRPKMVTETIQHNRLGGIQGVQGNSAAPPQLITALAEKLDQLHEHHAHLRSLSRIVRGSQPETGIEGAGKPQQEKTLAYLVLEIECTIEQCRQEVIELGAFLS